MADKERKRRTSRSGRGGDSDRDKSKEQRRSSRDRRSHRDRERSSRKEGVGQPQPPAPAQAAPPRYAPVDSIESKVTLFRQHILTPSGGWLLDLTVALSALTQLWDFYILGGIFIVSWMVLRISEREVALILGFGFDATIPLQYQLSPNPTVQLIHRTHLEAYWPIFIIATGVEVMALFTVIPPLFTLIVCLKTTACLAIWLALLGSSGSGGGGRQSNVPAGPPPPHENRNRDDRGGRDRGEPAPKSRSNRDRDRDKDTNKPERETPSEPKTKTDPAAPAKPKKKAPTPLPRPPAPPPVSASSDSSVPPHDSSSGSEDDGNKKFKGNLLPVQAPSGRRVPARVKAPDPQSRPPPDVLTPSSITPPPPSEAPVVDPNTENGGGRRVGFPPEAARVSQRPRLFPTAPQGGQAPPGQGQGPGPEPGALATIPNREVVPDRPRLFPSRARGPAPPPPFNTNTNTNVNANNNRFGQPQGVPPRLQLRDRENADYDPLSGGPDPDVSPAPHSGALDNLARRRYSPPPRVRRSMDGPIGGNAQYPPSPYDPPRSPADPSERAPAGRVEVRVFDPDRTDVGGLSHHEQERRSARAGGGQDPWTLRVVKGVLKGGRLFGGPRAR